MPAISVRVEAMRCHSSERVTQELLEAADDHQTSKLGTKHETLINPVKARGKIATCVHGQYNISLGRYNKDNGFFNRP